MPRFHKTIYLLFGQTQLIQTVFQDGQGVRRLDAVVLFLIRARKSQ
jgi:hypothetical protein